MNKESINSEKLNQLFQIITFPYRSANEARTVLASLAEQEQEQMATAYQEAFGGYPWWEKFRCPACGIYVSDSACPNCQSKNLPEAYPRDELKQAYFPKMISEFTPGGLLMAYNASKDIVGFSTGGFTLLGKLIEVKYQDNQIIRNSILQRCGVSSGASVFYDNETCILPTQQKGGLGRQFSQQRIDLAKSMGANNICGRTINKSWLRLKEQQLTAAGYAFSAFAPEGDTYEVEGNRRQFYWASKR